jgi:Glycosyl transferase family 2
MTSKPFFSIVVPTFSQQAQAEATVESILQQSFRDFEIIVCDNWSVDQTFAVMNSHLDSRVSVVRPTRHGLPASLMEMGWQQANGRYVVILSAGDALVPGALDRFKHDIDKYKAKFLFCRPAEFFDHRLPEKDARHAQAGKVTAPATTGRTVRIPSLGYLSSFYSLSPFFSWQPSGHIFERELAEKATERFQCLFRGPTPQAHGWPALALLTKTVALIDKPLFVRHQAPKVWDLGAASDGSTEADVFDVHEGWDVDLTEIPVKAHAMIASLADGLWGIQRHPNAKALKRFGRDEHTFGDLLVAEIASRKKNGFRVAEGELERVEAWRKTLPGKPAPEVLANRVQARAWSVAWSVQSRIGSKAALSQSCSEAGGIAEAAAIVGGGGIAKP